MEFKFYCVAIVIGICHVIAIDANLRSCLERYLMQKGKWSGDYPETAACAMITTLSLALITGLTEDIMDSRLISDAECLTRELRKAETSDFFIKMIVIKKSQLSESEAEIAINKTRNELKEDLTKIALQCEANVNQVIESFSYDLGMTNLTTLDESYCYAKYAADNDLLPLKNVELNPYGIPTTNIDCQAVIIKQERKVRQPAKEHSEGSVRCVVDYYRENNIYSAVVAVNVLGYVDLPKEIKDAEMEKAQKKLADFAHAALFCDTKLFLSMNI